MSLNLISVSQRQYCQHFKPFFIFTIVSIIEHSTSRRGFGSKQSGFYDCITLIGIIPDDNWPRPSGNTVYSVHDYTPLPLCARHVEHIARRPVGSGVEGLSVGPRQHSADDVGLRVGKVVPAHSEGLGAGCVVQLGCDLRHAPGPGELVGTLAEMLRNVREMFTLTLADTLTGDV